MTPPKSQAPDWIYQPDFLPKEVADQLFQTLREQVDWQQYHVRIFGKKLPQPRLTAWYGEPGTAYTYSGLNLEPLAWTAPLLDLRAQVQGWGGHAFNSVLLNLYRHGQDSMGWHQDDEKMLGPEPIIASVSLGASRKFNLRSRDQSAVEKHSFSLEHGSLFWMKAGMQARWQHSLPKTARMVAERINLTFRYIFPEGL
ncbi:MAG: alpha-ketoglutarate-dependent dioxygenase AlkB [Bacteroidota bacterium]